METTHTTPAPEPSPSVGSSPKDRRWLAVGAATLALLGAGLGVGVAQAQTGGDTTTTQAPDQGNADEGPDTDGTAPEGDEPTDAEIQAFRACMAENGVDLPEERPAPGERPERTEEEQAAFEQALDACEDLRPEGFGRHGGPGCDGDVAESDGTEPGADATDS